MPFELFIDWHSKDIFVFIPILGMYGFTIRAKLRFLTFSIWKEPRNLGQHVKEYSLFILIVNPHIGGRFQTVRWHACSADSFHGVCLMSDYPGHNFEH